MDLKTQRRLAASIFDCGADKVWIDPTKQAEVKQAITRADVRRLIKKGLIIRAKTNLQSRARARAWASQKARGRGRGPGTRKGAMYAGVTKKQVWIGNIRPLRAKLREMRDLGVIERNAYRTLYMMAKAGAFRSKAHLNLYAKEKGLLKTVQKKK